MHLPRPAAAALAVAGALALAACGKDDDAPSAASSPSAPVAGAPDAPRTTKVEVIRRSRGNGSFDPAGIYERESPGVVTVISAGLKQGGTEGGGLGSGFVVSARGEVATNAHVVTSGQGRAIQKAKEVFVRFPDGNQVPARVRGFDPFSDVALLQVDPKGLQLRPLPLGTTEDVEVGSPVAAIGSPFGEEQSLSVGVVSAKERSIVSLTNFQTSGAIQTDAAINQGNSGGPLMDADGKVIGINSQIRTESGDGTGVGFAVPVDTVKRSLDQLRRTGEVRYSYLGVATRALYPQVAARFKLPVSKGVWVQDVSDGGPADEAGLRAGDDEVKFQEAPWVVGGDVIVALDGRPVVDEDDLSLALLPKAPGDAVTLTVVRDGRRREVRVELGERPLASPRTG